MLYLCAPRARAGRPVGRLEVDPDRGRRMRNPLAREIQSRAEIRVRSGPKIEVAIEAAHLVHERRPHQAIAAVERLGDARLRTERRWQLVRRRWWWKCNAGRDVEAAAEHDAQVLLDQIVVSNRVVVEHEHVRARDLGQGRVARETLAALVLPDDPQVQLVVALVGCRLACLWVVLIDDDDLAWPYGLTPQRFERSRQIRIAPERRNDHGYVGRPDLDIDRTRQWLPRVTRARFGNLGDVLPGAIQQATFPEARSKSTPDGHVSGPLEAVMAQEVYVEIARVDLRVRREMWPVAHQLGTVLDENPTVQAAPPPIEPRRDGRLVRAVESTDLRPDTPADETDVEPEAPAATRGARRRVDHAPVGDHHVEIRHHLVEPLRQAGVSDVELARDERSQCLRRRHRLGAGPQEPIVVVACPRPAIQLIVRASPRWIEADDLSVWPCRPRDVDRIGRMPPEQVDAQRGGHTSTTGGRQLIVICVADVVQLLSSSLSGICEERPLKYPDRRPHIRSTNTYSGAVPGEIVALALTISLAPAVSAAPPRPVAKYATMPPGA